jgi:Cft2 family RNA processing exonuclease
VSFDNARENNNKLVDTTNLQNSKADSTTNNRTVVLALKAMKTAGNSTPVTQRSLKTNTNLMKTEMVEPNIDLMKIELVEPDTNLNGAE